VASLLVQLCAGPEAPTRAALAVLIAKTAADDGHDVVLHVAGDAVHLLREATAAATTGVGIGNVGEYLQALAAAGVPIVASRMSSDARDLPATVTVGDLQVEFGPPSRLVELILSSDQVVTY
jgi:uncharacterized protein